MTYVNNDVFVAEVVDQRIEKSQKFNTPQLILNVKLKGKVENRFEPGKVTPLDEPYQASKTLFLSLEPGERLTKSLRDLVPYGFDFKWTIDRLSPDHPKALKLVGKSVHVRCWVQDDGGKDRWYLNDPNPKSKGTKLSLAELKAFEEENADAMKSSREGVLNADIPF